MLDLWLGLGGLIILALIWLRRALAATAPEDATLAQYRANQQAVFKQRQQEIDDEIAAGIIAAEDGARLSTDLQRQLLADGIESTETTSGRRIGLLPALLIAVGFFAAAVYLYFDGSGYRDMQLLKLRQEYAHSPSQLTLRRMIELTERNADSRDGQRMALLAQLYSEAGLHDKAAAAWGSAAKIWPQDAMVLAQWGQSLYLAANSSVTPEARHLLQQAIAIDSQQSVALGLLGIDAFANSRFDEAVRHWVPLLRSLPPGSPRGAIIAEGLQRAKHQAVKSGKLSGVLVEVNVAQALQSDGNATLMVYALAQGSRMPLAVLRQPLQGPTIAVYLTEADAMAAGPGLFAPEQIKIVARVSRSGGARREAGDKEAESDWFNPQQKPESLQLSIQ